MLKKKNVNIIAAMSKNRGIGINNTLPWHFKKELQYFKRVTTSNCINTMNAVIMGRNTYDSLPFVLSGRDNYIVSKKMLGENVYSSLEECIEHCHKMKYGKIFIIGGSQLYEYALDNDLVDGVYLTEIGKKYECDTFFPELPYNFGLRKVSVEIEKNVELKYRYYENLCNECNER